MTKIIYRLKTILNNFHMSFFKTEIEKKIPKTYTESQKPSIAKTTLRKNKGGNVPLPDFKMYYKATVFRTEQHWHKGIHNRSIEQRDQKSIHTRTVN